LFLILIPCIDFSQHHYNKQGAYREEVREQGAGSKGGGSRDQGVMGEGAESNGGGSRE
jgi:hypothetical protein